MSLGKQALKSLYSSPWLLLGYLMSFAFQILQLKYASDLVIEHSSLIISIILVTSSVAQCGIPAKAYYDYVNSVNASDEAFASQISAYLSSLFFVTGALSISTVFLLIIISSYLLFSHTTLVYIFSAIYFVILPINQFYAGMYYAQGRANIVSIFILLEPLFRFVLLLFFLSTHGSLSTINIVLIYSLSSVLQFCFSYFVDSEYRELIIRSVKTACFHGFTNHLKVARKCWPYGMQQLISNFSDQFPTIVVATTMPPAASAYFVMLNRISSLASVLPTHFIKLSLASIPQSLVAHIIKPNLYVFRHPRLPIVASVMLAISIAAWIALTYIAPIDLSVIPALLTSILISVVVLFRILYLLIDAQFARMLMPTKSALVKAHAVIISLSIFLALRYCLRDLQSINQSFLLLGFLFVLLSATPIILIASRPSLPQP